MSGTLTIQREERGGSITLRLEGTFDAQTAAQLRRELEGLGAKEVVLDFSKVRRFVDSAVAVLTGGMDCTGIQLAGLGRHEEAMFRYFGIASSRSTERAYYTPEELFFT